MAYRFIDENKSEFGVRWLLRRMNIYPNAYYNYLKHKRKDYEETKQHIKDEMVKIYHSHKGVPGHRMIRLYLQRKGIYISATTAHKYFNKELGLKSITRKRKPHYDYGKPHKIFENKLQQDFIAPKPNKKWCTDFTYVRAFDGDFRYNCTIIDLCGREVVASITDRHITSDLAIRTLRKALESRNADPSQLILHSDQGSQFTSKAFTDYCEAEGVTQSMSKAGYPYDNAPMERYFNTLKNEYLNLFTFNSEEALYKAISTYAYVEYNHTRPNSANGGLTPFEARCAA